MAGQPESVYFYEKPTAADYAGDKIYGLDDFPVNPAYFPEDEKKEPDVDPAMVKDKSRISWLALLSTIFFFLCFAALIVLLAFIGKCEIGDLCQLLDLSSTREDDYKFATFPFYVPTVYIWAAAAAGALGMCVLSLYAVTVIKKECGTARMVEIATYIREGAIAFLIEEYMWLILLVIVLFILIGFGTNWREAGCYAVGAALSALTGFIGMSIATRGNVRTTAAAEKGLKDGLNVAFRAGAVMGLTVVSLGLLGLSAMYLIFQDVRALAGFSAGASTIALFARVGGGIYTKAADVGADLVGKVEANIPEDDPRNPATIADNVGDNVGDVAGMGADLFESYVGSIVSTGILAASLPYFFNQPYALCVFNHLYIDQACGSPTNPPDRVSLANLICQSGDFFLNYPDLNVWASNTMFIAVPYMLAVVGILAGIICTIYVHVPASANDEDLDRGEVMEKLLWALRINIIISSIFIIGGAAGICWGFFGPNSTWSKARGFGKTADLPVYQLETGARFCQPWTNYGVQSPLPVGQRVNGFYTPMDGMGYVYPKPEEVPWRLFIAIIIGLYLGMIIGWLTEYFTAGSYKPTQGIAASGEYGAGAVVIQGLGVGMLSTCLPLLLVMAVIVGSYNLFGTYAIALSAVGMLSTLGVTMATDAYGPVADNAGGIAEMAELPSYVRDNTDALDALGNTTAATGKGFSNGSAVLTAYALLLALVMDSGLVPSPRALVQPFTADHGTLITDYNMITLVDIYVVASILIGIMLPFLFGAFTMLAVSRAAQAMIVEVRRQFREIDGLREGRSGVRPDHLRCIKISTRAAIFEMVLPGAVAIMSPLIIGFGFGQKALAGLLLGGIGSGYMLGIMMSNAGGAWDNAKKLVESGFFVDDTHEKSIAGKGSQWHKATVAGDTVGDPFKDTSGPSMNILIKLMTVFGLIAVPLMNPGLHNGWIGAILLGCTLIFGAIYWYILSRYNAKTKAAAREVGPDDKLAPPALAQSTFYEPGPYVDMGGVNYDSQFGQAIGSLHPKAATRGAITDPLGLPGMNREYDGIGPGHITKPGPDEHWDKDPARTYNPNNMEGYKKKLENQNTGNKSTKSVKKDETKDAPMPLNMDTSTQSPPAGFIPKSSKE